MATGLGVTYKQVHGHLHHYRSLFYARYIGESLLWLLFRIRGFMMPSAVGCLDQKIGSRMARTPRPHS